MGWDIPVENEVGTAPSRGLPKIEHDVAEQQLSDLVGRPFQLSENAVVSTHPTTCPACGAATVEWGCSDYVTQTKEEIHPLVWDESEWMADSFVCRTCHAGWFEDDDSEPITWVRPYWRVG